MAYVHDGWDYKEVPDVDSARVRLALNRFDPSMLGNRFAFNEFCGSGLELQAASLEEIAAGHVGGSERMRENYQDAAVLLRALAAVFKREQLRQLMPEQRLVIRELLDEIVEYLGEVFPESEALKKGAGKP